MINLFFLPAFNNCLDSFEICEVIITSSDLEIRITKRNLRIAL